MRMIFKKQYRAERAEKEVEEHKQAMRETLTHLHEKEHEFSVAQEQLRDLEASKIAALREAAASEEKMRRTFEDTLAELRAKLTASEHENKVVTQDLNRETTRREKCDEEIAQIREKLRKKVAEHAAQEVAHVKDLEEIHRKKNEDIRNLKDESRKVLLEAHAREQELGKNLALLEDVKSQLENTNNALSKHGEELEVELNKAHTFRDMLKERLAAAEAQVATLQDSLKQKSEECLKAQTDLNLKEQELASAEELQKNTDLELERLRKLLSEAEAAASVNADGAQTEMQILKH